ncbi:MAG: rRNA pseudouridine synthase [Gemmatimonadaceae bacterium]|nr:rRNA pseudouridine synthase [Gemmatimonadaceae bacterium]
MSLDRYLSKLGYGTRKQVADLLSARRVTTADGRVLRDSDAIVHDDMRVDGELLDPPPGSVLLLNKPLNYVCSSQDRPPLVYDLFSPRFLARDPVMSTVGRLDADTTGFLLLTDAGALNHRLTSPRTHVPKTYRATLDREMTDEVIPTFASGTLLLRGETTPLAPAQAEPVSPLQVRLTITEGRYHQVRRMFAALGYHVTALHREGMGPLTLGDLESGAWRVLSSDEVEALRTSAVKAPSVKPAGNSSKNSS